MNRVSLQGIRNWLRYEGGGETIGGMMAVAAVIVACVWVTTGIHGCVSLPTARSEVLTEPALERVNKTFPADPRKFEPRRRAPAESPR